MAPNWNIGSGVPHWRFQKFGCFRFVNKQRLNFLPESIVIAADLGDKSKPLVRVTLERSVVYALDPLPTLGRHGHLRYPRYPRLLSIPDPFFADFHDTNGVDRPVWRRDRQSPFSHELA